jgi:hypothetical protein
VDDHLRGSVIAGVRRSSRLFHSRRCGLDRQGYETMESNPYESPNEGCKDPSRPGKTLTRRTVFWTGMTSVLVALIGFNGSHALFVHSKSVQSTSDSVVAAIDILALVGLAAGCVAMIASHWFREARRKYSWRRDT